MSIEKLHYKHIVAENLEGGANTENIITARIFSEELEKRSGYVIGCILQGSQFKGYSSEKSDIDLSILWDSSGTTYNSQEYWNIRKLLDAAVAECKKTTNSPANIQTLSFDINSLIVEKNISVNRFRELALIFSPGFGKKLKKERQFWVEKINNLESEKRNQITSAVIETLVDMEIERYMVKKLVPTQESRDAIKESRRKLWREKFSFWGLQM